MRHGKIILTNILFTKENDMKKQVTPYMGWNSWDCYGAAVTEDIVRANAEFMAKNLKKYG